ncbi:ExbD/TolR family protein [Polynucleobacter kasalickyi]|uniref:Outer membrane transport energization protein ExbD n=1 Tax=Polynucleobacter kasalickyi TaxID=1938817 RepID=A0A1W1YLZ6_9BURK|nr:biopolymer transporter ExbD [Polynucleobacter kasalickyi]SMC37146.1 outer membrane transport energization protein ExbD [Polynucleobacter kasalickyi]
MKRFAETTKRKSRIEIIPMIDVMMFLLVFFVLISLNVIPALGLKTKLPTSSSATQENPPKRIIVTLLRDGTIQADGQLLGNLEELTKLINLKKQEYSNNYTVVIQGDEAASMQSLIDVMDVLKKNNVESMTISAKRKA